MGTTKNELINEPFSHSQQAPKCPSTVPNLATKSKRCHISARTAAIPQRTVTKFPIKETSSTTATASNCTANPRREAHLQGNHKLIKGKHIVRLYLRSPSQTNATPTARRRRRRKPTAGTFLRDGLPGRRRRRSIRLLRVITLVGCLSKENERRSPENRGSSSAI